jgi:hypothetical protein
MYKDKLMNLEEIKLALADRSQTKVAKALQKKYKTKGPHPATIGNIRDGKQVPRGDLRDKLEEYLKGGT